MAFALPEEVDFFPHPLLVDDDGLLAMGSSLDTDTLLLAYQFGIFPWTSAGQPLFWWYTHPRCVMYPDKLKVSKSMRPYLNSDKYHCTMDTAFKAVIEACRNQSRPGQEGTWLFDELQNVMCQLHEMGHAHSVEVWEGEELVGGLYGLAFGDIFFGESMFARKSNTSKLGFIRLVGHLKANGYKLIDCQQETAHIMSLGAELMSKEAFFSTLKKNILAPRKPGKWQFDSQQL